MDPGLRHQNSQITNRKLISNLLLCVGAQKIKVLFDFLNTRSSGFLTVEGKGQLACRPQNVPFHMLSLENGRAFNVSFEVGYQHYFFSTQIEKIFHKEKFFSSFSPVEISKIGKRMFPRYALYKSPPLLFSFCDPSRESRRIVVRVKDFNVQGVCFVLNRAFHPDLTQGVTLKKCALEFPSNTSVEVEGVIKHWSTQGREAFYGFCFSRLSPKSQQKLFQYFLHFSYPSLVFRSEVDFEKIWELFQTSGYLGEKESIFFQGIKTEAKKTWKLLSGEPFKLSLDLVYAHNHHFLGTLSSTRLYEKSWFFHHLAIQSSEISKGNVYSDLYLGVLSDFSLNNREIDFFLAYYNSEKLWHKKFFDEFAAQTKPSKICIDTFQHYEILMPKKPYDLGSKQWEIAVPDLEERTCIFRELHRRSPKIVRQACNFDSDTFDLPNTRRAYAQKGLGRKRELLVLREKGQMVAFAMVESATSAINIFNLLDVAWAYYFRATPESQTMLMKGIVNYYYALGKKSFLFLAQKENPEPYIRLGFKKICELKRIIFHRDLFHDFRDYLYVLFSRMAVQKNISQ